MQHVREQYSWYFLFLLPTQWMMAIFLGSFPYFVRIFPARSISSNSMEVIDIREFSVSIFFDF